MSDKPRIVNILDDVADESKKASESAISSESGVLANDKHGVCPKCNGHMGFAMLAGNEEVYYCKTCRVSSPIEIHEGGNL